MGHCRRNSIHCRENSLLGECPPISMGAPEPGVAMEMPRFPSLTLPFVGTGNMRTHHKGAWGTCRGYLHSIASPQCLKSQQDAEISLSWYSETFGLVLLPVLDWNHSEGGLVAFSIIPMMLPQPAVAIYTLYKHWTPVNQMLRTFAYMAQDAQLC